MTNAHSGSRLGSDLVFYPINNKSAGCARLPQKWSTKGDLLSLNCRPALHLRQPPRLLGNLQLDVNHEAVLIIDKKLDEQVG